MDEGTFTGEERDNLLQEIERLKSENNRLSDIVENNIYKIFFDAYPDIVFKIDPNYLISYVHIPHQTSDFIRSVTNKNIFKIVPDVFHDTLKHNIETSFQTGEPVRFFSEGEYAEEYRYYENYLAPIKDRNGDTYSMFFYSRNITVQKNIELSLIKNQHTLKTIFENSGQFIAVMNPERKVIWYNKKTEEWSPMVFGRKLELDCLAELSLPEEFRQSFIDHFDQVLLGNSINYVRKHLLDSKPFYLEVFMNPVYDKGTVVSVSLIGLDVTRHKENEEYLQKVNAELMHQNEQLNEFSYIISHNLRGPIATLLGLVDLFESNTENSNQSDKFIFHIKKTLQKLDTVIVDLNFVVTNHDSSISNYSLIHLEDECNSIADLLSIQIQKADAKFVYDFSAYPEINSVKSYIHNILYNLISNAIKYKSHSCAPIIYLSSYKISDDKFCIECRDNGIGLDLERHRDKLFGFYKRFHSHVEGKGIGLHLVKKQIELLKGQIEVASAIDQGTTFKIILPIQTSH